MVKAIPLLLCLAACGLVSEMSYQDELQAAEVAK